LAKARLGAGALQTCFGKFFRFRIGLESGSNRNAKTLRPIGVLAEATSPGGASMTTTIVLFVVLALVFLAAMHEEGAI
jgi:hypothetical protein